MGLVRKPASATQQGEMTTGIQTIAGAKTFTGLITPSGGIASGDGSAFIGAGKIGQSLYNAVASGTIPFTNDNTGYQVAALPITLGIWQVYAISRYDRSGASVTTTDYTCLVNTSPGQNLTNAQSFFNYVNINRQIPIDYLGAEIPLTCIIRCDGVNCYLLNGTLLPGTTLYVHAYSAARGAAVVTGGGFIMATKIA